MKFLYITQISEGLQDIIKKIKQIFQNIFNHNIYFFTLR